MDIGYFASLASESIIVSLIVMNVLCCCMEPSKGIDSLNPQGDGVSLSFCDASTIRVCKGSNPCENPVQLRYTVKRPLEVHFQVKQMKFPTRTE